MTGPPVRVWRYRFRATFGRRWGAYLSLVLLIGLIGGLAMGALAAARRTESSCPTFLASTNPSNLSFGTALWNPFLGYTDGYNGTLIAKISRMPDVRQVASYAGMYTEPLNSDGQPTKAAENANMDVDWKRGRPLLHAGPGDRRPGADGRPEPARRDHDDRRAARTLGLHVGQTVPWGTYANSQLSSARIVVPPKPAIRQNLTLVGTVVLNNAVVQDDIDANGPVTVILTPALTDSCSTAVRTSRLPTSNSTTAAAT